MKGQQPERRLPPAVRLLEALGWVQFLDHKLTKGDRPA